LSFEIEEGVFVEYDQVLVLAALEETLGVLPGDGAVVAELGQGSLDQADLVVHVNHLSRQFTSRGLGVTLRPDEMLTSYNVGLNEVQSSIVDEPLALGAIDIYDGVVKALVEVCNLADV
jgi:hypothetical protein